MRNFIRCFLLILARRAILKKLKFVKINICRFLKNIEIEKPINPIRVGVIGELYVLMEPFSNFYIEKELAQKGIEVHRFVTVSSICTMFLVLICI